LDPEFAAADEAAKKAKQKIHREKETARLAARDKVKRIELLYKKCAIQFIQLIFKSI